MPGFNPYFALAGILALGAAAAGGFVKGKDYAKAKREQAQLGQLTIALNQRDEKQHRIEALEQRNAELERRRQANVREIDREVPKVIEHNRVVYDRTCIDADGVELLDRAQAVANGARGQHPGAPAGQTGPSAEGSAHR